MEPPHPLLRQATPRPHPRGLAGLSDGRKRRLRQAVLVRAEWLRRLFPFYGWARTMLPEQAAQLARAPGRPAVAIRAMSENAKAADREGEHTPEWLRSTATLPLGDVEEVVDPAS